MRTSPNSVWPLMARKSRVTLCSASSHSGSRTTVMGGLRYAAGGASLKATSERSSGTRRPRPAHGRERPGRVADRPQHDGRRARRQREQAVHGARRPVALVRCRRRDVGRA